MITTSDLVQASKLAAFTAIAWTIPPRWWRRAAAVIPSLDRAYRSPELSAFQRVLGPTFGTDALSVLDEKRRACSRDAKLQILGSLGPWRSWRPDIQLRGEDQLRAALDDGRGAILWVTDAAYSTLIFKMALHQAGYRAYQLSRPQHGFSNSSFGVNVLNPLWCRVEDRFIAERVFIREDNAAKALSTLHARLAANHAVIITVGAVTHRFVEVPFFGHRIRLPTGPIRLAYETGAALLPGFAFATDKGGYEVTIEPALGRPDDRDEFADVAVSYARRLEPFVERYPEQWTGWDFLLSRDDDCNRLTQYPKPHPFE
jgi:hypothetical protein